MRGDLYKEYFTAANLMGPNSIRLLDELLEAYPLRLASDQLVLDLGCGTGLTSLFAARETGATVYANDLWISAEDNRARFAQWGMADRLIPVHENAVNLHFEPEMFDAVVSIDSYHYFAGEEGFFAEKILPFVKRGGRVLIAVPGMKNVYGGRSEELTKPWLGDEAYMFKSADQWRRIIGEHEDIAEVRTWEMDAFDVPWQEWIATGNRFAMGDLEHYERIIKPYTAFVGIMVRKKG
ncbi:MAG: class I SAM-dependent methyltransferase [Clostridia bacterium]|nr:class I SAM-dependent methyltransferase [Clostridia bacterium]